MANAQIATSLTIVNSLLGFQAISLTNFATSAQSLIGAGSKVEVAGAFFNFTSNETPNASSWTAVGTGNTAYIIVTPSGTAGTQILTAYYSDTAPVWDVAKQGWYGSSTSTRYVGSVYKAGTSGYEYANIAPPDRGMWTREVAIGPWNMLSVSTVVLTVDANLPIRSVECIIYRDVTYVSYPLFYLASGNWSFEKNTGLLTLSHVGGGWFESTNFNDPTQNRGVVRIGYTL